MTDQFNQSDISFASRSIVASAVSIPQNVITLISPADPRKVLVQVQAFLLADYLVNDSLGQGIFISSLAGSVYPNVIELPTRGDVYGFQTPLVTGTLGVIEYFNK